MPSRLRSLVGWSARVFGEDIANRVFSPLVADWQHEADAHVAMRARAVLHARWLAALARTGLVVSARELVCWRVPREYARPVLRIAALVGLGGQGLVFGLILVLFLVFERQPLPPFQSLMLFVQFATITAPLALGPAAARLARLEHQVPERRWMLVSLALAVAFGQLVIVGWGVPLLTDLVLSEVVCLYGYIRPQGAIPLHELFRPMPADAVVSWWAFHRSDLVRRLLWVALPVAIAVFGWRLGSRSSARRDHRVAVAWAVPALLLLLEWQATIWLPLRGEYGLRATLVRLVPVVSLLALAWWQGPAFRNADGTTLEHSEETR